MTELLADYPAIARRSRVDSLVLTRCARGRRNVVEHWSLVDMLGLLQQLGAVPASPAGPEQLAVATTRAPRLMRDRPYKVSAERVSEILVACGGQGLRPAMGRGRRTGNDHGFVYAGGAFSTADVAGARGTLLTRIKNGERSRVAAMTP